MSLWIVLTIAALLGIGAIVRGAWPLGVAGWPPWNRCFDRRRFRPIVVIFGAVLLLIGGASTTRGAIFDGSPKAKLSEREPSIFKGENYELDEDMDSVHFTHRFWGP